MPVYDGPVPKLALVVASPALHLAISQHGTRVVVTKTDARRCRDARDLINWDGALSHGPIPELSDAIATPANHRIVSQQGTRVRLAQSDARRRRDTIDLNRGSALGGGPVPELAVGVGAPTVHLAVRDYSTRVVAAQSDILGTRNQ